MTHTVRRKTTRAHKPKAEHVVQRKENSAGTIKQGTAARPPSEPGTPARAPRTRKEGSKTKLPSHLARPRASSKLGLVVELLEAPEGAPLARLIAVTGWLPHTTRAALTGLRKRGYAVTSEKATVEGARTSVYRIRPAGAA
jgi:hypothetical protein